MAGFHTKTFTKHDSYMTPRYAWENIKQFIPQDKILWECMYGDGESGKIWKRMGYNVIHKPYPEYDFFEYEPENYDIIVSNPAFSKVKDILPRLKSLGKPFIMLMPCSKMATQYFRKFVEGSNPHEFQIIVPRSRIHFKKLINGKLSTAKSACNFDCYYYCYLMDLPNDIIFLGDEALKRDKPEWKEQHLMGQEDKY